METITKEDGTQIEVLTAEEIEAQRQAAINEAVEKYKAENPDKSEELTKAQDELKKFQEKDLNFGNLRTQKEAAEKKVEEILKGVDDKIGAVKKEVLEGVLQDHYNDTIKTLAGGDAELQKKIEFHYKRLTDSASTKEEATKKLTDAFVLATKSDDPGALNASVISSGGVHRPNIKQSSPVTPELKGVGSKLGLTEEDWTKYGN